MSNYLGRLRKKPRICYFESDELITDEYVYCEKCTDFVYEYCSIHGPLLVIPDDKVPSKTNFPSSVPRAALSIPHVFLHLARSSIPGAGLGVFATLTLPRGIRFGPYRGIKDNNGRSEYYWQLYKDNAPAHTISSHNESQSNWMRYVNCSRHYCEQNIVAFQYKGEIYYRTIKVIPKFTELLVFYGSESAASLQIDLRKYNIKKYYQEVIGIASTAKQAIASNIDETQKKSYEMTAKVHKEVTNIEHEVAGNVESLYKDQMAIDDNKIDMDIDEELEFKIELPDNDDMKMFYERINTESLRQEIVEFDTEKNVHTNTPCGDRERRQFDAMTDTEVDVNSKLNENEHENIKNVDFEVPNEMNKKFYVCQICNQKLSINSKSRHQRRHTNTITYNCTECNFKTYSTFMLNRHKSLHTAKLSCEFCSYKSDIKRNLHNHLKRVHQYSLVVKCEFCNYATMVKASMDIHVQLHWKGNAIKCNFCDYLSNESYRMKRHVTAMHLKSEIDYSCNICSFKTKKQDDFANHKINVHGYDWNNENAVFYDNNIY